MALRIDLGPGEKLFIGQTILTNGGSNSHFALDGVAGPVLKERDTIDEKDCDTAIKRLYASIQRAYLHGSSSETESAYALNIGAACMQGHLSLEMAEELGRLTSSDGFKALKFLRPLLPPDTLARAGNVSNITDAPKLGQRHKRGDLAG